MIDNYKEQQLLKLKALILLRLKKKRLMENDFKLSRKVRLVLRERIVCGEYISWISLIIKIIPNYYFECFELND